MFEKLFSGFASPRRLREAGILGMNRRNYNVIAKNNRRRLYPLVDDKVQTKMLANKIGINTPGLIGVIEYQHEVKNILDIVKNYKEFVVKPAHGSGGKGVLVIKDYTEDAFTTPSGKQISYNELYQHVSNVLSGLYSLGGKYDVAVIEELDIGDRRGVVDGPPHRHSGHRSLLLFNGRFHADRHTVPIALVSLSIVPDCVSARVLCLRYGGFIFA